MLSNSLKCFGLVGMIALSTACSKEKPFNIEDLPPINYRVDIEIEGIEDSTLATVFTYLEDKKTILDSVYLINEKAIISGQLRGFPERYQLEVGNNRSIGLFLDSGIINVRGSAVDGFDAKVTGTFLNDQAEALRLELNAFVDPMNELYVAYSEAEEDGDEKAKEELDREFIKISNERNKLRKKYITQNLDNIYAPYIISRTYYQDSDLDVVDSLYELLDSKVIHSKYAQTVKESIDRWKPLRQGNIAPEFEQTDSLGNIIRLSDFRGKLLLVDFWAAWCGPCRRENPNIVEAYEKFHDRGFEVLGVSLDNDRQAWLKAIKKDKLAWFHVSDLEGWNNEVSSAYGIKAIPYSLLLNKEGRIIAKHLRGPALHDAIENNL